MRAHKNRQAEDRSWRVWDLDAEMRYWPVLNALPPGAVCEVGSGTAGLASWTNREIIGVDPSADEWHVGMVPLPNIKPVTGTSTNIPLADRSVAATVAVDTFEHILPDERQASIDEMIRVTASGGRVLVIGPTGPSAAKGDRWLWDSLQPNPPTWALWLTQHFERGVPTVTEMDGMLTSPRIMQVRRAGYMNIGMWRAMHAWGRTTAPLERRLPAVASALESAFGWLARRYNRGPFYRWMFVIDLRVEG